MRTLFPDSNFVPPKHGTGKRLVVAEAPGETESLQGEPLVGASGSWFDSCCRKAGLDRSTLTLVNILQCRPPENVFPTDSEARAYISSADADKAVKHCIRNHVLPLLKHVVWTRIDLLGEKALRWLAGKTDGIFYWRGSPVEIDTNDVEKRVTDA